VDHQPQRPGPAWANSLFEDNAEFGLGMMLGGRAIREQLASDAASVLEKPLHPDLRRRCATGWRTKISVKVPARGRKTERAAGGGKGRR
jgi:pyruvate/2-oxoacid:ferredoxin oxidoreductase beta subunit